MNSRHKHSFTLDGKIIPFERGDTIMDAALRAGEYIPHLCHNPEFRPHGSCRICIVNINGRQDSACTHPAEENAVVDNQSTRLMEDRRTLLQMLFVEGNHVCPACEKSGACQLQAVAYYCEMLAPHFTHFFPKRAVDASHSDEIIDYNRCILCELCVRASRNIDHKSIFSLLGRGIETHLVVNSEDGSLGKSCFSVEDKAAQVCPVGALLPKHHGYETPIGTRLYDRQRIDIAGDAAPHAVDKNPQSDR